MRCGTQSVVRRYNSPRSGLLESGQTYNPGDSSRIFWSWSLGGSG